MSFSPQDIETLKRAKAEGKTKEQALAMLAQTRQATTTPSGTDPNSASADLAAGFQGAKNAFQSGLNRQNAVEARPGLFGRLSGSFANGLRTTGEMLGSLGEGALRALPGGTTVANATGAAVGAGVASAPAQAAIGAVRSGVEKLPEGVQQAVSDAGGAAMGALQIGGALTAPGAGSSIARTAFKSVDDVLKSAPRPKFNVAAPRVGEIINKYRAQLSDVNPQVETILKQQRDPQKVFAYFDQAEKAALDPSVPMATQLAANRAKDAYDVLDKAANEAGRLKSEMLDSISSTKLTGNRIAGPAIDNVKTTIGDRFGIQIDNKGKVTEVPGRMASVDKKSQALISEYVGMLRKLGQAPTARMVDDFVDAAQRMLYKQSSPNLFEVADEPVIAFLKQQTGIINDQLKKDVDNIVRTTQPGKQATYGELNERYSSLLDASQNLSKRLGTEGDKGASLIKSLFSPQTGEPTRRLFQQIKDETGIDLFEEATLAKFAMETVGDTRSKSLLQQIDALAGDVSKVNLMEPGSWLNYIREKADLDGRELAETIIKQSNAETR